MTTFRWMHENNSVLALGWPCQNMTSRCDLWCNTWQLDVEVTRTYKKASGWLQTQLSKLKQWPKTHPFDNKLIFYRLTQLPIFQNSLNGSNFSFDPNADQDLNGTHEAGMFQQAQCDRTWDVVVYLVVAGAEDRLRLPLAMSDTAGVSALKDGETRSGSRSWCCRRLTDGLPTCTVAHWPCTVLPVLGLRKHRETYTQPLQLEVRKDTDF